MGQLTDLQKHIVVVGASVAGVSAIGAVRAAGFEGRVTLIGAESTFPYDRPPLSKEFLVGELTEDDIALCARSKPEALDVDLVLDTTVLHVDAERQALALSTGEALRYDGLLLATGLTPRRLTCDGADLAGIHYLRTIDDARALRADMVAGREMVVIGTGFIGGEVASSGRQLGLQVTMVEVAPTAFSGAVEPPIAEVLTDAHVAAGAKVLCGRSVTRFCGADRVEAVMLSDGTLIEADFVVVGIGAVPQDWYLERSTLVREGGVLCDQYCQASAPAVYAAGDVCRWYNGRYGRHVRVEHWTNAVEQGAHAARNLALELAGADAERAPYSPVPYFWSRQCGCMFQYAGARSGSAVLTFEGDIHGSRWGAISRVGDVVTSAFTANWPALAIKYRRMLSDEGYAYAAATPVDS